MLNLLFHHSEHPIMVCRQAVYAKTKTSVFDLTFQELKVFRCFCKKNNFQLNIIMMICKLDLQTTDLQTDLTTIDWTAIGLQLVAK